MSWSSPIFWHRLGAASGALSVAMGAFGAHGLKNKVSDQRIANWNTAAQYHLLHSILITVTPLIVQSPTNWSARLLTVGVTLFSGSLYALVLTDSPKLGAVTPLGGLALIAGWIALGLRV